jgi:ABC-type bacteriocin/lantibiotic exporter with double-glycine peptidase domain
MGSLSFVELEEHVYSIRSDMERIAVVGTTGSGKTTLARNISQRLSITGSDTRRTLER